MTETLARDHIVTSIDALERLYGQPFGPSIAKEADRVTAHYRAFIETAPFFALASGGPDGLDYYRRVAAEAGPFLKPDGKIMLEFGDGQAERICEIFQQQMWIVEAVEQDYTRRPRMLIARKSNSATDGYS